MLYSRVMAQEQNLQNEIELLSERVDELLDLNDQLRRENAALLTQCEKLQGERSRLFNTREEARQRVAEMVQRLRSMERSV
ncbi:MAG: TIGR02449 family protein [Gammaproteobacteria bacterium]|nr:TIGR02449 family protein [Gammaproteobacteria bacterium]